MYYILFYKTVEDYVERREPYREQHLELIKAAYERGELLMAGALSEPANGAILVFRGDSPAAAKAFVDHDPYVENSLIVEWEVRPWNVVVGG